MHPVHTDKGRYASMGISILCCPSSHHDIRDKFMSHSFPTVLLSTDNAPPLSGVRFVVVETWPLSWGGLPASSSTMAMPATGIAVGVAS